MIDRLMGTLLSASSWPGGMGWTLAWQSTLWLAAGLVAARVWRRRAGRAHLLLVLATCAAIISPLLTIAVRQMEWGVLPAPPLTEPAAIAATSAPVVVPEARPSQSSELQAREADEFPNDRSGTGIEESRPPAPDVDTNVATLDPPQIEPEPTTAELEPEPAVPAWTTRLGEWLPLAIASAWLVASLVLTVRLATSFAAAGRMARRSREESNPQLLASLREAADALGLRTPPLLRVSPLVRCPMIWCWGRRPIVLLPESAGQSQVLWRSVFLHELAHLVRRDQWSALWAELLVIVLPWQPLAWIARRRLAFLREQACDDWVLAAGGEPTDYAESLLQLVPQGKPVHALAAVSSRESLKRRLEHVLSGVRITPKVGRRWIVAASLVALAAIGGVGFAQQGKRSAASPSESVAEVEAAQETKPPVAVSPSTTPALPTSAPEPTLKRAPPALPPGVVLLRGRVLLPNGQPAVGASVHSNKSVFRPYSTGQPPDSIIPLATFATDSQGKFGGNVNVGELKERQSTVDLWATLAGYGLAHATYVPDEKTPIVLHLLDEEPIRGRLIDLEGRPIRDARVEVFQYFDTTAAAIDRWIASISGKGAEIQTSPFAPTAPTGWPPSAFLAGATSNAEGRFELRGVGRNRPISLKFSAPRIAMSVAGVVTRPMPPLGTQFGAIVGSQFERVLSPG
ncbi:MAG TPA: M56 family metallopeptidase, partial [Planctomycetaceae bacterium]|nr:M56 family metallopeptidase [Planctomycetaceae bacterium]